MALPCRIRHAWRRLPPVLPALVALFWLAGARSDAFLTESATACIRVDACGRAIKALASSSAGLGWVQSPTPASAFTAGASAAVCALRPSPGLGLAVRVALRGLRLRRGALELPAVLGIRSSFEVAGKSGRGLQPLVRSELHTPTETNPTLSMRPSRTRAERGLGQDDGNGRAERRLFSRMGEEELLAELGDAPQELAMRDAIAALVAFKRLSRSAQLSLRATKARAACAAAVAAALSGPDERCGAREVAMALNAAPPSSTPEASSLFRAALPRVAALPAAAWERRGGGQSAALLLNALAAPPPALLRSGRHGSGGAVVEEMRAAVLSLLRAVAALAAADAQAAVAAPPAGAGAGAGGERLNAQDLSNVANALARLYGAQREARAGGAFGAGLLADEANAAETEAVEGTMAAVRGAALRLPAGAIGAQATANLANGAARLGELGGSLAAQADLLSHLAAAARVAPLPGTGPAAGRPLLSRHAAQLANALARHRAAVAGDSRAPRVRAPAGLCDHLAAALRTAPRGAGAGPGRVSAQDLALIAHSLDALAEAEAEAEDGAEAVCAVLGAELLEQAEALPAGAWDAQGAANFLAGHRRLAPRADARARLGALAARVLAAVPQGSLRARELASLADSLGELQAADSALTREQRGAIELKAWVPLLAGVLAQRAGAAPWPDVARLAARLEAAGALVAPETLAHVTALLALPPSATPPTPRAAAQAALALSRASVKAAAAADADTRGGGSAGAESAAAARRAAWDALRAASSGNDSKGAKELSAEDAAAFVLASAHAAATLARGGDRAAAEEVLRAPLAEASLAAAERAGSGGGLAPDAMHSLAGALLALGRRGPGVGAVEEASAAVAAAGRFGERLGALVRRLGTYEAGLAQLPPAGVAALLAAAQEALPGEPPEQRAGARESLLRAAARAHAAAPGSWGARDVARVLRAAAQPAGLGARGGSAGGGTPAEAALVGQLLPAVAAGAADLDAAGVADALVALRSCPRAARGRAAALTALVERAAALAGAEEAEARATAAECAALALALAEEVAAGEVGADAAAARVALRAAVARVAGLPRAGGTAGARALREAEGTGLDAVAVVVALQAAAAAKEAPTGAEVSALLECAARGLRRLSALSPQQLAELLAALASLHPHGLAECAAPPASAAADAGEVQARAVAEMAVAALLRLQPAQLAALPARTAATLAAALLAPGPAASARGTEELLALLAASLAASLAGDASSGAGVAPLALPTAASLLRSFSAHFASRAGPVVRAGAGAGAGAGVGAARAAGGRERQTAEQQRASGGWRLMFRAGGMEGAGGSNGGLTEVELEGVAAEQRARGEEDALLLPLVASIKAAITPTSPAAAVAGAAAAVAAAAEARADVWRGDAAVGEASVGAVRAAARALAGRWRAEAGADGAVLPCHALVVRSAWRQLGRSLPAEGGSEGGAVPDDEVAAMTRAAGEAAARMLVRGEVEPAGAEGAGWGGERAGVTLGEVGHLLHALADDAAGTGARGAAAAGAEVALGALVEAVGAAWGAEEGEESAEEAGAASVGSSGWGAGGALSEGLSGVEGLAHLASALVRPQTAAAAARRDAPAPPRSLAARACARARLLLVAHELRGAGAAGGKGARGVSMRATVKLLEAQAEWLLWQRSSGERWSLAASLASNLDVPPGAAMTWRDARAAARLLALLPANATPGAGQWAADLARELVAALAGARADRIPPRAAAVAVRAAAARGALTPALLVRLAVAAGAAENGSKGRGRAGARWDAGGILAVARQLRAARGAAAAAGEGGEQLAGAAGALHAALAGAVAALPDAALRDAGDVASLALTFATLRVGGAGGAGAGGRESASEAPQSAGGEGAMARLARAAAALPAGEVGWGDLAALASGLAGGLAPVEAAAAWEWVEAEAAALAAGRVAPSLRELAFTLDALARARRFAAPAAFPLGAALAEKLLRVSPAAAAAEPRAAASVALALTALARGRAGGWEYEGLGRVWEHGEALLVALAGDGERLDGVPSRSLASLLAALAKARVADPGLQTLLLRAAQERAARRALTVGQAASVLSSAAASSLLWTAPALVEDLLRDMAPALLALPPASFSIQHCALLASAFAKAKVFDEAIFRHISRAVRLPERAPHEFSVEAVGVLLFAFSRVQAEDPALLAFLEEVIVRLPAAEFSPQASLPPSLLLPLPVSLLYTHSLLAAGHLCHGLRLRRRPPPPRAPGRARRRPGACHGHPRAPRGHHARGPSARLRGAPRQGHRRGLPPRGAPRRGALRGHVGGLGAALGRAV